MKTFTMKLDDSRPRTPERAQRIADEMHTFVRMRVGDRLRLRGDSRLRHSPTVVRMMQRVGCGEALAAIYGPKYGGSVLGDGKARLVAGRDGEDTVLYCAPPT